VTPTRPLEPRRGPMRLSIRYPLCGGHGAGTAMGAGRSASCGGDIVTRWRSSATARADTRGRSRSAAPCVGDSAGCVDASRTSARGSGRRDSRSAVCGESSAIRYHCGDGAARRSATRNRGSAGRVRRSAPSAGHSIASARGSVMRVARFAASAGRSATRARRSARARRRSATRARRSATRAGRSAMAGRRSATRAGRSARAGRRSATRAGRSALCGSRSAMRYTWCDASARSSGTRRTI